MASQGNQICIIDGKFMIVEADDAKEINFKKLLELVEHYRLKLKNNLIQLPAQENSSSSSANVNSTQFQLTESLNGSEVYQSLLHSLGISDIDSQLQSVANTESAGQAKVSVSIRNLNDYVCFIIADFDQDDATFVKLEEIQSKLSNLFNTLSQASTTSSANLQQAVTMAPSDQKRFIIYGWPILYHCIENNLNLTAVTDVDRPLYCKLMSGCFVCFTGFRKENKNTVAHCIKLVHYMGGSVRKEYNKKITHLIVKSTLSTKYKTAYNIGKCHLLTEDWIIESWKHRNEISFNVNNEEFLKRFKLKALYSLSIAFYGFTKEETQHMKEVTIENGGTPINDINDPQCTHIVINDQEVKQLPSICSSSVLAGCPNGDDVNSKNVVQSLTTTAAVTPTSKSNLVTYLNTNMSPFSNTRASIVRTEWFWASIQICCRASECLYEFTKPKTEPVKQDGQDPPNKRIKLSLDNLLSHETLNSSNNGITHTDSPHNHTSGAIKNAHHTPTSSCVTSNAVGSQLSTTSSSLLTSVLNNSAQKAVSTTNGAVNKLTSSNNLLSAGTNSSLSCPNGASSVTTGASEYDSPTIVSNTNTSTLANTTNHRLSTNRVNMSNNNLSTSASLLDATADDAMSIDSPFEKHTRDSAHGILNSASSNGASNSKKVTKRSQRIYELYETEKRFVNILHAIIYYFKEPIEEPDQVAGPILDQTEVREIFGNLPPIYEVHCKIKDRLERLVNRLLVNEESTSVGEIYLDNSDALLKTYPPFVNFYEKTKDAILNCDKLKPRFHAFLKIAQSKPECGRQTLVELLIRPVQRLPSTLLLLDDILRETPKQHRDHDLLTKAIGSLKEVMTHINEDKRKIENQLAMFMLINDIDNCPATLLSSHRSFVKKVDVHEMSNELLKKGAPLTLFLFTDCLEICKPRTKLINASKSPVSKQRTPPQKCYKHISLFSLNNITKVCDILQKGDDTDLFGILCRLAGEKDKFYSFKVIANASASNSMMSSNVSSQASQNCSMVTSNSAHNGFGASSAAMLASTSTLNYNNYSSIYASSTNLHSSNNDYYHAVMEKKDYLKLLAQGICNVKCITEYENILCTVEAQQLQIDLNESGGLKKLDAVKSYARRVSRAFSFQDTPNKIKKTISSVFRSPFQSYSQQSLNEQKASKLTSLASLQLTPTLMETKRKFITLQKSTQPLISPPKTNGGAQSQTKRSSNHPMHLLSTRTLRNLRSTTTSTINGIAAAMSSGGSSSKMSHYYSSIKHRNSNSEKKDASKNKLLKKQESAQLPSADQIKYPSYEDDDENGVEDIVEYDDIIDDEAAYDENEENLIKPSSVKRSNAYAHDDQQSMTSEFDANNLDQENMDQHQYYKQQLNINKSKKQILMSTGATTTVTSTSHFSNISNKVCRKMDTL